jgi:hypothetical protein
MNKQEARKIEREEYGKVFDDISESKDEREFDFKMSQAEQRSKFLKAIDEGQRDLCAVTLYYSRIACEKAVRYFEQQVITDIDQRLLSYAIG